jgi:hypothetical protein
MLIFGLAAMYVMIAYKYRSVAGMVVAGSIAAGAYAGVMHSFWRVVRDMKQETSRREANETEPEE